MCLNGHFGVGLIVCVLYFYCFVYLIRMGILNLMMDRAPECFCVVYGLITYVRHKTLRNKADFGRLVISGIALPLLVTPFSFGRDPHLSYLIELLCWQIMVLANVVQL